MVIGQYTKETSCVYHDDYGAAKALAEQVGREASGRVAYIGVTREDKAAGAAREDGFREGLKRSRKRTGGILPSQSKIHHGIRI